jgi:SAM-dependent methyltransferase
MSSPACTLCGGEIAPGSMRADDCPHCGAPARARSLPALLGELGIARDLRANLPALVFAPAGVERKPLGEHFAHLQPVTLYGNYGGDVALGIDARDLSRFAPDSFAAHMSLALFDYFVEQDKALADAFRVLAPGGIFATLIVDGRVRNDASAPAVQYVIEKKPGYYDYWPEDVALLSVAVGRDWLVAALRRAGFADARYIAIPDPASGYVSHWFVGRKPESSSVSARLSRWLARRKNAKSPEPVRIAATGDCTICGKPLGKPSPRGDCPSCGAPARLRSLPRVWDRIASRTAFDKPLLGFALAGAERKFLERQVGEIVSVSLHGDYGRGHISGVDVRDLSRFADGSFSCVLAILLFDYFPEHEQALAEVARVLKPGGVFATAIFEGRLTPDAARPTVVKTIKSAPGYFDYVPEDRPLVSIRVGRGWFRDAMERAGFTAEIAAVEDTLSKERTIWFIGRKR